MKRVFDILAAGTGLLFISPILLMCAILLKLTSKGPVFFKQERPGKDCKIFKMVKFRTMTQESDAEGNLLPDEQRLFRFGKLLRKTSVDELPSLWNVLKGDMSLVGPRPLLVDYLPIYNERQKRRHEVKPGLTGWAQINGRNAITWEQKFEHDIWYVENRSFWLDLKIILLTIPELFKGKGIYGQGGKLFKNEQSS